MPQNNTIVKLFTTKLSRSFGSKMFSSSFDNFMRFYRYNGTIWVSNKSRHNNCSIGEVVNSWNIIKGASMNTIGQNLRFSLSISLSIVCVRISSISKMAISKVMSISITQILGISLSISLSIVGGVRISISISKVAISKMMSIGQILRISLCISLSIIGGVRISRISKVAISKVMSISISQILGISLWFSKTHRDKEAQ